MKNLQNHFTNIEQSKRLLELGVPADSADCYYNNIGDIFILHHAGVYEDIVTSRNAPCWSAGRLIEIIMLCGIEGNHKVRPILDSELYEIHDTLIEYIVQELEYYDDWYDFSKLED